MIPSENADFVRPKRKRDRTVALSHDIVRSAGLSSAAAMTGRPAMARRPAVAFGVRRTFFPAVFRIGARRAIGTPAFPALVAAGAVRAIPPAMITILRAAFGRSLRLGRFLWTLRHRDRKQRYDKDRNQKQQFFSHHLFSLNNLKNGGRADTRRTIRTADGFLVLFAVCTNIRNSSS